MSHDIAEATAGIQSPTSSTSARTPRAMSGPVCPSTAGICAIGQQRSTSPMSSSDMMGRSPIAGDRAALKRTACMGHLPGICTGSGGAAMRGARVAAD